MTKVCTSSQLPGCTKLWRYLSLDKLIDLRATGELFFAPLASFIESDPFERYLPAVAMEAHAGIFRRVIQDLESVVSEVEHRSTKTGPPKGQETFRQKFDNLKAAPALLFQAINQSTAINCWHESDCESEAMWRLCADNGKAGAIETDVDALRKSIESRDSAHLVDIFRVKYLDFFDKNLQPKDCVVEGHLTPLLKRVSYRHEFEVRAFIGRPLPEKLPKTFLNLNYWKEYWKPAPVRLPVEISVLVKRVHVSPYSRQPFDKSVTRVCELLGLPADMVTPSKMLCGHEELLKSFSY
jgi:hypothetical protein